ncbi:MAG: cadherin repeat domain-containing protein [Caldilineaceae bacterium]
MTTVTASGTAPITYSIVGGADAALFTIDENTGKLSFLVAPDFENPGDDNTDNIYEVTVRAGNSAGIADQTINVIVDDVLDEPPLVCSAGTGTNWVLPDYFVEINSAASGISGICIGCSVSNTANIIDSNVNNFGTIQLTVGLGASGTIAVRNSTTISYPAGTFAGFVVQMVPAAC